MKKIIAILLVLLAIVPSIVSASTQALDVIDTIKSVGLTPEDADYKETEDQVMVYFFRGSTCNHCHDAVEYFNSILKEHGSKFKMRSYEVYENADNQKLKDKVVKFFKDQAPGVPYIIVGESTFYGFGEETGEKILAAIESEYRSSEKYDMFEAMEKHDEEASKNNGVVMGIMGVVCVVAVIVLIYIARKD